MRIIQSIKRLPSHIYLLIGIFLFIFVFPLVDHISLFDFFGPLSYSIIIISLFSVIEKRKDNEFKILAVLIIISVFFIWLRYFFQDKAINVLSFLFNIIVFISATIIMIRQIVESKKVDSKVIIEVINGYLLIGVMFTLTNTLIWELNHQSINIPTTEFSNLIYYSFITLTTIGYGDIAPQTEWSKMVSVLYGLTGQLYLTIIVALIIGKFLNKKNN